MGKKSKRRQTTSSKKGSNGDNHNMSLIANPMAEEARRIRTNEDGHILTDSYYRFSSLICDSEGVGVIDLNKTVELYAKFRQDNQFLPVPILEFTFQKCHVCIELEEPKEGRLKISKFFLTILEDHEEFVRRHIKIDFQFGLYRMFCIACANLGEYAKLCTYSERVFPYLLAKSERGGFDPFGKAYALVEYAHVCKKFGKYDDSKKYYDTAFLIFKEHPQEDDVRKIDGQARIRLEQADLILIQSIGEHKLVTKDARRNSIDKWNESSKLCQDIIDNAKPEGFSVPEVPPISRKYRCHLLIGIEYGKLKQWDDAEKHFELARKIVENDIFSVVDMYLVFMWMGKLHFDRYIHNFSTIAHDEQNIQNLRKAEILTSIALQKFKTLDADSSHEFPVAIYLFRANIFYFFGDTHDAISCAINYLKVYMSDISGCSISGRSCYACHQPHRNKEVKYYCTACNAVFYCSKVCQYTDWKGESDIFVKHRLFCPLLKSWKKLCEMRPEVEHMASQDIEDVIRNTEFENMFQCYFESHRTVKSTNQKKRTETSERSTTG